MPHLIIEYSSNLETEFDVEGLVGAMHGTAVSIDALPTGGIRTRASRRDVNRIADGHPDNGFINVTLRIARGRSRDVRRSVGETMFTTLQAFSQGAFDRRPIALSLEIQEIDPDMRWKESNIRDYMEKRDDA